MYCVFAFSLILVACPGPSSQPLTREHVGNLFNNPAGNQVKLIEETLMGCVHIPARDPIQRAMVGFQRTGESCSITISRDNNVTVSFVGNNPIPLVSASSGQHTSDIFFGNLGGNQVLVVQHHQGKVVSVTQTVYDNNGHVVYGRSGNGDYIKECHLGMTTSERAAGRRSCEK